MKQISYKQFTLELSDFDTKGNQQCVAFLNGNPIFGTFSSNIDVLSAYEKMINKIESRLKK